MEDIFAFVGANTEDGNTAGDVTINSYADLQTKSIKLGDGTNMVTLNAAGSGGSLSLTFPTGNGSSGQYLRTDGSETIMEYNTTDSITEGNTTVEAVDTGSDGHVKFSTEGTERMRIDANGNVGLGDNSPGTLLQLSGSAPYLTLKNSTSENTDGGCESKVIFEDHANNALAQIQGSHDGTSDDTKGDLIFSTNSGSGLSKRMKIDCDGNTEIYNTFKCRYGLDIFSNNTGINAKLNLIRGFSSTYGGDQYNDWSLYNNSDLYIDSKTNSGQLHILN